MSQATYADVQPVGHDMKTLELMMKERSSGELATLRAVNSLAKEPYKSVKGKQRKWNIFKALAIYASIVPLIITLLIYYISPMVTQEQYAFEDVRVWGMSALLTSVGIAVAVLIDFGRANILDKANTGIKNWLLYCFMSLASIAFSTTGMMAVANFYASGDQQQTKQAIADAKAFVMANAALEGKTLADIDAEQTAKDKLYRQKGSGYKWAEWNRDTKRLEAERVKVQEYLNAKALVDGKQSMGDSDESSNWLFNTYANIFNSGVVFAALVLGILMNVLAEIMALIAHARLIKLNARLEVTEQQWSAATMVANEAMIVADSTLVALNHNDYFAHTFKMPFHILNQYQNNGKRYGDFVDVEAKVIDDYQSKGKQQEQQPQLENMSDKQKEAYDRYLIAKDAEAGETVKCPNCSKPFEKSNKRHVYCSNSGADNCSDNYHNLMNPARLKQRKR